MFKKIISIAVTLLLMSQALTAFATDFKADKSTPTLDGVISAGEYSDDSKFVMDKAFVDSVGGCYAGEMTDGMSVTYYFAWDDTNLYMAAVTKDSTRMSCEDWDPHGTFDGDWAASDALQTAFFARTIGLWYTVGGYDDGTLASITHYQEQQDMSAYITGKCVYNDTGAVYEIAFPWYILRDSIDTMLRIDSGAVDEEGNPITPQNPDVPYVGCEIPVMLAYLDRYDRTVGDTNVRYKNVNSDLWPSSDDFKDQIVLVDSTPAPETAAPDTAAPETAAPDTAAPSVPTADLALIAGALALAAAAAAVIAKKRR